MSKKQNVFNPIKEEKDGVVARRMIWSTASMELALEGLRSGRKLIANPFYENNTKLFKGDLVFERTSEEINEWKKCKKDIIYFAEKYCKLMTPEGIKHVKLRDYQKKYLKHLVENRLSIYLACRQCAKTTTSAIFLLWYILFNVDKNALVVGNKRKTSVEILDKIKKIFTEIPYFLKPGVYKWNEGEIVFDNGCRIMAEATTINSGISFTFHTVLWDEAAHVAPNIIEKFYNNLFPTITAGKARFIISSTQNGYNLFYRLCKYAEQGISEYKFFKTDWYEVPEWNVEKKCWEPRDESWHQQQIANYGSEEAFNKQFGTNFDVNANTLISTKFMSKIRPKAVEFVNKEIPGVEYSENYFWHPNFEPMDELKKSFIIITIDISEGLNQDYTTYVFNKITNGNGDTECIGLFHVNNLDTEQCTRTLNEIINIHMNSEQVLVSLETNLFGELFIDKLLNDQDNTIDSSILIKYWNKAKTDYTYGIKISSGNKSKGCSLFKKDYETGKIINDSTLFLGEIENFCDNKGTNTYAASFGHDDVVMAQIQLIFAKQSLQFKNLLDSYNIYDPNVINDKYYNPYELNDIYNKDHIPFININEYERHEYDSYRNNLKKRLS